jgi:tRNA dimethylallyltransferase
MTLPRVLFIVGQTAVGKTALSLAVAQQLGGEIISADSRQIYRHMDIGTAKASPAEQAQVPHHLIDVVDPSETFTLAQYRDAALVHIHDIHARGRLPMVVGGTGQYVAALCEGWSIPEIPPDTTIRTQLEARAASEGGAALYAQLQALDPLAATQIHATNVRRVIRALEVCLSTGQPFSQLRQAHPLTFAPVVVWLTCDTPTLYARIDARVDAMLQAGLPDEVLRLRDMGYGWELPAMSGIGYREFQPWCAGTADMAAVAERIKFNTHAFARRQATWFRRWECMQTHAGDVAGVIAAMKNEE